MESRTLRDAARRRQDMDRREFVTAAATPTRARSRSARIRQAFRAARHSRWSPPISSRASSRSASESGRVHRRLRRRSATRGASRASVWSARSLPTRQAGCCPSSTPSCECTRSLENSRRLATPRSPDRRLAYVTDSGPAGGRRRGAQRTPTGRTRARRRTCRQSASTRRRTPLDRARKQGGACGGRLALGPASSATGDDDPASFLAHDVGSRPTAAASGSRPATEAASLCTTRAAAISSARSGGRAAATRHIHGRPRFRHERRRRHTSGSCSRRPPAAIGAGARRVVQRPARLGAGS